MTAFAQRPTAVLLLAAGLSLFSLGLCLIAPAVSANGITATHQLAQARRELRREATLEVAGDATVRACRPQPSERVSPALQDAPVPAALDRAEALRIAEPPRRLVLHLKVASSPKSEDDLLTA